MLLLLRGVVNTSITHLECGACGATHDHTSLQNLCRECQRPLLARYDLDAAGATLTREVLERRAFNLWRYAEVLPVQRADHRLHLGEGGTPLLPARRTAERLGLQRVGIKEEGANPTTSFKARGMAVAISMAVELGVKAVSVPSAGNAAGAMSAYAARAGLEAHVFMPQDVPVAFVRECTALGANVTLIDGLITDCGKAARDGVERFGRFDVSTLKEPYRLEGKKTMGYELYEQGNGRLPDVVVYPTGGGTGLIGMWKAFDEMQALGWIGSERPRLVSVQSTGCAPIVRAFNAGAEFADPWQGAETIADGLRVPAAVGDFLILRALRETHGKAVAVDDIDMMAAANRLCRDEGIFVAPEGGACLAALETLVAAEWIQPHETVVLFNTGSGHKYAHLWDADTN